MTAVRLVAGLAVLLAAGSALAQPTSPAIDGGFLLTELTDDRWAEASASVGVIGCDFCQAGATSSAFLGDVAVQVPLAPGLVATGTLTAMRLGPRSDQTIGESEWAVTPVRLGLRKLTRRGPWTVAAGAEVSILGELGVLTVTDAVRHLRDDPSRWPVEAGTARAEAAAAWRQGRLRAQAQVALVVEGVDYGDSAVLVRAGGGGALALTAAESLTAELTATLLRDGLACQNCERNGALPTAHAALGARSHRGPWRLGAVALIPLREGTDGYFVDGGVSATFVVGRRF